MFHVSYLIKYSHHEGMETPSTSRQFSSLTAERCSFVHQKPPCTSLDTVLGISAVRAAGLTRVLPRDLNHMAFSQGSE